MLVTLNSMLADILLFIIKAFIIYIISHGLMDHAYELIKTYAYLKDRKVLDDRYTDTNH